MSDQSKSSGGTIADQDASGPAAPDAPAGEPSGEIADEFAGIPSPPKPRSWLAVAVVLLGAYLIVHQRSDLAYALSPAAPVMLGDAPTFFQRSGQQSDARADIPLNRYVRVEGRADFESGLSLDTQGQWTFRQFFRVLGTESRLFVQRQADPLPVAQAEHMAYSGRLIQLDKLSFSKSIRDYYANHVAATRFFALDALKAAVASGKLPLELTNTAGDPVTLGNNLVLTVSVVVPETYEVTLPIGEQFPSPVAAKAAIDKTGASVLGPHKVVNDPIPGHQFRVKVDPAAGPTILGALADVTPGIRIHHAVADHDVPVRSLQIAGDQLLAQTPGTSLQLTEDTVRSIRTVSTLEIPPDALILLEGERPSRHYRALVATAFLAVFAAISLVALIKGA